MEFGLKSMVRSSFIKFMITFIKLNFQMDLIGNLFQLVDCRGINIYTVVISSTCFILYDSPNYTREFKCRSVFILKRRQDNRKQKKNLKQLN